MGFLLAPSLDKEEKSGISCYHSLPQVKSARRNRDGWKAVLTLYDYFLVLNNVDHLKKQADMKIIT